MKTHKLIQFRYFAIAYAFLVAIIFSSCNNTTTHTTTETKTNYIYQEGEFTIVEVDSCEYILSDVYAGNSICHKGNCRFCAERTKK